MLFQVWGHYRQNGDDVAKGARYRQKCVCPFLSPFVRNPADILSKHWGYQQVWKLLKPLLFWQGDTLDILDTTIDLLDLEDVNSRD